HTHIHYGSSKVNEKVVNNIHIFDHEIAFFTEENIIFIDHLNHSDFTLGQIPDIFDSNCENQSIDLPLYHENKLFGIMRFEASTKPFSETFIFEVMSIFEFLKKRELKKIISHLNMKLEMLSSYIKGIINKQHIAIFKYHISSKTMHFEEGSQLLFNKKNLIDLEKDFFITYIHPNDLELLQLSIKQIIRDHQSISLTYRLKIDDEYKTYLSHMIYTSIYHEQYIIGLIEDLTNPLAKVQNLEKYQINLDTISKEKIKELEDALYQAEESMKAKSSFISNMSHEIRTPMNSIIGYAHLLTSKNLDDESMEYAHRINDASKHLLSIVNDILDISKIEAGKIVIEHINFHLDKLLLSVKDIFEESLKQKRLYLDIETLHCPNFLVGDENRIRQILINLISNAIKFTETGGISLVVSAKETYRDQNLMFEFRVKDTGIGMTPSQLNKLFNDFEQADISTTRIYGGSGLGLSISKRLALLMKGNLNVSSSLNDGTEFILTLPLAIEKDNLEENLNEESNISPRKGSHILLADDNVLNQKLAKSILENMGMKVTLANQGHIALDLAKKTSFDLIILDIQMPVMDGLEAAKNIRLFDQKTPIIALSGNANLEDKEIAYQAGMNDYIAKPIDPTSLYRALVRFIPDVKNNE
ncbi:MAG: response regulator, partial [Acholeplasmataceae bacterium]|nr:response regulator [Acholeplasmataceae bacterium]